MNTRTAVIGAAFGLVTLGGAGAVLALADGEQATEQTANALVPGLEKPQVTVTEHNTVTRDVTVEGSESRSNGLAAQGVGVGTPETVYVPGPVVTETVRITETVTVPAEAIRGTVAMPEPPAIVTVTSTPPPPTTTTTTPTQEGPPPTSPAPSHR